MTTGELYGHHEAVFDGRPEAMVEVRRLLTWMLAGFGDRVDDAVTCIAELATNALKFSRTGRGGKFTVEVDIDLAAVTVAVRDQGGATSVPHRSPMSPEATGGRGLHIVAELSDKYGFDRTADGWSSWFTILRPTSLGSETS